MTAGKPPRVVRAFDADSFVLTTADGTHLEVEADGPADAPVSVIFVHGYTLNLTSFRHQRASLATADNVRRIFYDQRGFGGSARGPRGKATLTRLAEDLAEVVALAPGRVVLVGHSMGGMTILELARIRPDLFGGKIRGTVLIATAGSGAELKVLGLQRLVRVAGEPLLRALHRTGPLVRLAGRTPYDAAAWLFHDPRSARAHRREFALMVAPNRIDVLADYLGAMLAYDARTAMPELRRTTTVVVAGRSDPVTSVATNQAVATGTGGTLVVVPRAGHMVTFEDAATVNEALWQVLDTVAGA